MIENNEVDVSEFIKFNNSGIEIATYVQVREALIKRYKESYGQDIDLSTATADGIFINNLALIINNILQSFKNIYNNLDVNIASGKYLDNLCYLANIQRKKATRSNVSIEITNNGSALTNSFEIKELQLVDSTGKTWSNIEYIPQIDSGKKISILFECDEDGQIEAPANSIYQTLDGSYNYLSISQPNNANVGLKEETDAELRDRRSQSAGADGTTVLDSLIGALLEISGIRDVYIYNNNGRNNDSAKNYSTMKDGTQVQTHDIYVVIRYEDGVIVEDSTIGNIIFDKLTPGIRTTETIIKSPNENKNYIVSQKYLGSKIEYFDEKIYWKKASPINPTITITLNKYDNWNDSETDVIKNELKNYLNELKLSTDLYEQDLLVKVSQFDPLFLGKPSYRVSSVVVEGSNEGVYKNTNTYYKYNGTTDIIIN